MRRCWYLVPGSGFLLFTTYFCKEPFSFFHSACFLYFLPLLLLATWIVAEACVGCFFFFFFVFYSFLTICLVQNVAISFNTFHFCLPSIVFTLRLSACCQLVPKQTNWTWSTAARFQYDCFSYRDSTDDFIRTQFCQFFWERGKKIPHGWIVRSFELFRPLNRLYLLEIYCSFTKVEPRPLSFQSDFKSLWHKFNTVKDFTFLMGN